METLNLAHRHSNPGAVLPNLTPCFSACRPFLNLLGDESNAVRVQVMASLVQTLDQFCIANEEARTRAFADFLPALLAADAGCGYCWRIHHHLMLALPHFVHMFTSDEVCPSTTTCWPCCSLLDHMCISNECALAAPNAGLAALRLWCCHAEVYSSNWSLQPCCM